MNTETNKLVTRRFIEEVVNTGNVERLADFISPDWRESNDRTGQTAGLDSVRAHVLGVRQTFPDLHLTVEQQIAEGDWVATRITAHATHLGWWLGIKPTGRRVAITGVNLDRVVNGRIVEHGGAANMFEALLSIDAVRVVGGSQEGAV
jgi:predicted ester cyclase